jgi:hypothetical protein
MRLILLSNFLQVLNSSKKHYIEKENFLNHIRFTTIYLLQKQKLNP